MTGEAEVAQFEDPVARDEDVGRFYVSVHHAFIMHMFCGIHNLYEIGPDLLFFEWPSFFYSHRDQRPKIAALCELELDDELVVHNVGIHILDNVRMAQYLQQLDLGDTVGTHVGVHIKHLHLLHGYDFACFYPGSAVDG
eukprot:CAMPEP_0198215526 /NCGR_PEP_ID=MMETSP1445-20131203/50552_1 /TAXON_ID=36898 /ORGANISM="Pyramimonas sp., Strain CCMP2087" /LENGTH=138 /DNA_ID=CAMNT_0043891297 /DNA_START=717 /DNA_END=1133 /DNA_ORIENTATION=+